MFRGSLEVAKELAKAPVISGRFLELVDRLAEGVRVPRDKDYNLSAEYPDKMNVKSSHPIMVSMNNTRGQAFPEYEAVASLRAVAFDVSPPSPNRQLLNKPKVDWVWNISPKKGGNHTVTLIVEMRRASGGSSEQPTLISWVENLGIEVEEPSMTIDLVSISSMISSVVGLVSIVGGIYTRRRQKGS